MKQHIVKQKETLWGISKQYYGKGSKWEMLYKYNAAAVGQKPSFLRPGVVLDIPKRLSYRKALKNYSLYLDSLAYKNPDYLWIAMKAEDDLLAYYGVMVLSVAAFMFGFLLVWKLF